MRLTNKNRINQFSLIYTISLIVCILCIFLFFIDIDISFFQGRKYLFLLFSAGIFFIYFIRGREIFDYDSDGEVFVFKNRGVHRFPWKPISDEFPKYKLIDFYIINGLFFRKLYVKIDSKKGHFPILRYDITYLDKKQIKDLQHSLHKALKQNNTL